MALEHAFTRLTPLSVLTSILSNTYARTDAVCTLSILNSVDLTDHNDDYRTHRER
jgi:hypothetical protein